jgi:DNA helicase-2/ATP-dependent DNA helicase PcrA
MESTQDKALSSQVSDYVTFVLAFGTYLRYFSEAGLEPDEHATNGLVLWKRLGADSSSVLNYLRDHAQDPGTQNRLNKAFEVPFTHQGMSRAFGFLQTALRRGGMATVSAIFKGSQASVLKVKAAIAAATIADPDKALDEFSVIVVRNTHINQWIDTAAARIGPRTPSPLVIAVDKSGVASNTGELVEVSLEASSRAGNDAAQASSMGRENLLLQIEEDARSAAAKSLGAAGREDTPPTKSEVAGIAAATVAAALSSTEDDRNIPEPLRKLDPEQRAAAVTGGKVLLVAAAGSGKTATVTSRIEYLVKDKKVPPSKILACSFNRKAAKELQERLAKKCGEAALRQMSVGTMHSLSLRFIVGDKSSGIPPFGTKEEQGMFSPERLIAESEGGYRKGPSPLAMTMAVRSVWKDCEGSLSSYYGYKDDLSEPPKAKKVGTLISQWRGNDVSPAQALANARTLSEKKAAIYYDISMGLKGGTPGWKPACGSSGAHTRWMNKYRPGGERLGDLDDMVSVYRDILRRDPKARRLVQSMYDHVVVDEAQDQNSVQAEAFDLMTEHVVGPSKSYWVVGDPDQCVHKDTMVQTTENWSVRAAELKTGDSVLSYRNGLVVQQTVKHVLPSGWDHGLVVQTASGKSLTMSPNHKIWAHTPGVYSGGNGYEDLRPTVGKVILFTQHARKGSCVRFEWVGDEQLDGIPHKTFSPQSKYALHQVRKWFSNYREALAFAEFLAEKVPGSVINKRIVFNCDSFELRVAADLLPGMRVLSLNGMTVQPDEIVSVKQVQVEPGDFIDLDVDDASNFFGNGILSHNSIYAFRGARADIFNARDGREGWQTKKISTNYRCDPEIVKASNRLISHTKDRIQKEARPNPQKPAGKDVIEVRYPRDNVEGAVTTLTRIEHELRVNPTAAPSDYAVLSRTNAELNDYETACIIAGVPYTRAGGTSFLEAPETKAVLGYLTLAGGTDFAQMQDALISCLTKPDRGLFMGASEVEKIVKETIRDFAREMGKDAKSVNPLDMIMRERYADRLAYELKRKYESTLISKANGKKFIFERAVEELKNSLLELGSQVGKIKGFLEDKEATATDAFNYILDNVSATTGYKDNRKTTTLREQISSDLAVFSDDDEETEKDKPEFDESGAPVVETEENPARGLGAVQFLFMLTNENDQDRAAMRDPNTAAGFMKKLESFSEAGKALRVDLKKWAADQAKLPPEQRESRPKCVVLATIHSTKGAEWPNCFVLMSGKTFPPKPRLAPGDPLPTDEELEKQVEHERNLAYVAMTRAEKSLTIVAAEKPSRFILEAGLGSAGSKPELRGLTAADVQADDSADSYRGNEHMPNDFSWFFNRGFFDDLAEVF